MYVRNVQYTCNHKQQVDAKSWKAYIVNYMQLLLTLYASIAQASD